MHYHLPIKSLIAASLISCTAWAAETQMITAKQAHHVSLKKSAGAIYKPQPLTHNPKKTKTTTPLPRYAKGEVIVKYKKGVSSDTAKGIASSNGLQTLKVYGKLSQKGLISVVKSDKTTEEMIRLLKSDPNVESVSPNYIRKLDSTTPDDPDFSYLWGMNNSGQTGGTTDADIDAPEAWDVSKGSSDVVVAVFDTGISYRHTDLQDNLWVNPTETPNDNTDNDGNGYIDDIYGADVAAEESGANDGDPADIHGHGTHVSGTIGAKGNNTNGISGVNWEVGIMALKVFRPSLGAYDSDILEAIDYVLDQKSKGVNIVAINASYGGYGGDQTDPMNDAIKGLGDAGVVFCAAAGNDATDNDSNGHFPSSYNAANIIAVASTDHTDTLSWFSNYGATSVDLAAPGSDIYSTLPISMNYAPQSGDFYFEPIDGTESWFTEGDWYYNFDNYQTGDRSISDGSVTGDTYPDDTFKYIGQSIDLSGYTANPNLSFGFYAKIDVEPSYDSMILYFYTDETGWEIAGSWDGWDQPMQAYAVPLSEKYLKSSFAYAIALDTDYSDGGDGIYFDDIGIGIGTPVDNYGSWSGTSMATPHVTGAVGLIASKHISDTAAERKARILNGVDILPDLSSVVSTGGRLNLKGAIGSDVGCPDGYHLIQGTNTCILGTVETIIYPYPQSPCGGSERLIQGTQSCEAASQEAPPGLFLPSCAPGSRLVQGTNTCQTL